MWDQSSYSGQQRKAERDKKETPDRSLVVFFVLYHPVVTFSFLLDALFVFVIILELILHIISIFLHFLQEKKMNPKGLSAGLNVSQNRLKHANALLNFFVLCR